MLGVVALRWNKPLFEVEKWDWKEVLRHFRAVEYEIEKNRPVNEDE